MSYHKATSHDPKIRKGGPLTCCQSSGCCASYVNYWRLSGRLCLGGETGPIARSEARRMGLLWKSRDTNRVSWFKKVFGMAKRTWLIQGSFRTIKVWNTFLILSIGWSPELFFCWIPFPYSYLPLSHVYHVLKLPAMYLCFWVSLKTLLALFRQRMVEELPVLMTRQSLFETDSKAPGAGTDYFQ